MLKRSSANANSKTTGQDTPCPTFGLAPDIQTSFVFGESQLGQKGGPPALACGVLVAYDEQDRFHFISCRR